MITFTYYFFYYSSHNDYINLFGTYNNDFILVYCKDKVTVGNVNQFEKTVEGYSQNTVGIIVTSQKGCSIKSSKCAKSSKLSANIVFTSINKMETDIQAYFLLRKDHLNHCKIHDLINIIFEKLSRIM